LIPGIILPEVNASVFELFLDEVSSRHLSEYIVMFLDGASWHKTKKLELPDNMKMVFLPHYSPELNPAEHLWDCIRENWFPNKTFKSIDAVEDTLVDALVALENDHGRVQRLTGFSWIVNDILNAT
jgi:transposase